MAVRLAESLRDQGKFDRDDVEHLKIHPRRLLCGAETAYDTGLTFATVFRALKSGKSVEEATQLVAHSAGCNAAHRCPPLAMAAFIADDDLVQTTMSETKITHVHQLAVESAVASSRICRELIQGSTWDNAISKTRELLKSMNASHEVLTALNPANTERCSLDRGGTSEWSAILSVILSFAPDVLRTALYFVENSRDFNSALDPSLTFAGSANYCPVIVGALAGARYGRSAIHEAHFTSNRELSPALLTRLGSVVDSLAAGWSAPAADPAE
ncbi:uncharacterized protein ACA1_387230 [Acanthamoeba castellanii str. Neff]|uniref:Uncharacterized protein n=1 Tax=Acanthamoeba castellanii (strain ATCC 30010 / Neff) TaxID=1257118 RepID=L8GE66_ACACF|nr:uncharacterized protein ACA1_387230 [Acanthamoeba castellanii str. Neff]ELR11124.1 hypothetical protein ACA1_387230 [Acanthamoeba castellanii str. Neff]